MPRGSTRKPPTGGPRPLVETNPSVGIGRLRNRLADLDQLDPSTPKDQRFETVAQTIRSNIRDIFGEDSPEDTNHWNLRIEHAEGPFLLGGYDELENEDVGSYNYERANAKRVKERRDGITRTRVILESLIKQFEERVAENVVTQHDSSRPITAPSPPMPQVTNNITYHVNQAASVGHGAIASDNALVQHNTHQTLNLDVGALSDDLTAIRKALLAQAAKDDDDHDAVDEAAKVAKVQKAIKAGEQAGIVSALRSLGSKTWALGEKLALLYVNFKLRTQLGLPPGAP